MQMNNSETISNPWDLISKEDINPLIQKLSENSIFQSPIFDGLRKQLDGILNNQKLYSNQTMSKLVLELLTNLNKHINFFEPLIHSSFNGDSTDEYLVNMVKINKYLDVYTTGLNNILSGRHPEIVANTDSLFPETSLAIVIYQKRKQLSTTIEYRNQKLIVTKTTI